MLLQRLPGLGIDRVDEETRKFIDEDFADVCRAGDVFQFILSPHDFEFNIFIDSECSLNELGINVAVLMLKNNNCTESQINTSFNCAYKNNAPNILNSDIARIILSGEWDIKDHSIIKETLIPHFILDEDLPNASKLEFHDCLFAKIEIAQNFNFKKCPIFKRCYFGEVEGRITKEDLPKGIFDKECDFDGFKGHDKTTKSIIALNLPLGTKVLLTVLKKLYHQSGSGRREKALISGLDHHAKRIIPDILKIIQSEYLAISYKKGSMQIWLPDRNQTKRVARILSSPTDSKDNAVLRTKLIV